MKAYTDLSQSKKLAEILPLESADMMNHWYESCVTDDEFYVVSLGRNKFSDKDIPCWSLAALLEVLPKIYKLKPLIDLEENSIMYSGTELYIGADNIIDACYEMILKLNELNLL